MNTETNKTGEKNYCQEILSYDNILPLEWYQNQVSPAWIPTKNTFFAKK